MKPIRLRYFLRSELGAVTVDWVVLTAVVVGLGGATVLALGGTQGDGFADNIGAQIAEGEVRLVLPQGSQ